MHNKEDNSFAFVVSTMRLLENAKDRKNICADGTYKIVWEGFPLVVVGTIDRIKRFHMIGMCLTSNERESEYEFVFKTLSKAVKKYLHADFEPEVLISDAAIPIRNAFYKAFPSAKHNVICWAHLARHVKDFKFSSVENKQKIQHDIRVLQTSPSDEHFENASVLFLVENEPIEPAFCEYMKRHWFQNNAQNWYTGYAPFVPEVSFEISIFYFFIFFFKIH